MRVFDRKRRKRWEIEFPDAAEALRNWWNTIIATEWSSFADLRLTYGTADYVDPYVVFNIRGNHYRLVVWIDYERGWVVMKWFGRHKEYEQGTWRMER